MISHSSQNQRSVASVSELDDAYIRDVVKAVERQDRHRWLKMLANTVLIAFSLYMLIEIPVWLNQRYPEHNSVAVNCMIIGLSIGSILHMALTGCYNAKWGMRAERLMIHYYQKAHALEQQCSNREET